MQTSLTKALDESLNLFLGIDPRFVLFGTCYSFLAGCASAVSVANAFLPVVLVDLCVWDVGLPQARFKNDHRDLELGAVQLCQTLGEEASECPVLSPILSNPICLNSMKTSISSCGLSTGFHLLLSQAKNACGREVDKKLAFDCCCSFPPSPTREVCLDNDNEASSVCIVLLLITKNCQRTWNLV